MYEDYPNSTFSFEVLINNAKINFLLEFYKLPHGCFIHMWGIVYIAYMVIRKPTNQLLFTLIAPLWPIRAVSPNIGQY